MTARPFSLQPILSEVFEYPPSNSNTARNIKSLGCSPPGLIYAAATDGGFKVIDAALPSPIDIEDISNPGIAPSKKPIDRLALLQDVDRLVCLAQGGSLTFHSLPSLSVLHAGDAASNAVVNSHTVKGVLNFAVDEFSASSDGVLIVIMKRKGLALFMVSRNSIELLNEVALQSTIITAIALRDTSLCFADVERYALMDIGNVQLMPLLPISQDHKASTQSQPNADQRPALVAIDNTEFLLASHTASTTLGVFVSATTGDPCRGTLEWPSNIRSLAVEGNFVLALLLNRTIHVHDLETQELLQILQLPNSVPDPRSLISASPYLLDIPWLESPAAAKLRMVEVPLGSSSSHHPMQTPPSSPAKQFAAAAELATVVSVGTFLTTRNSFLALRPISPYEQAESFFSQSRMREVLQVVADVGPDEDDGQMRQLRGYFNLRVGLHYIKQTDFDEAAACLVQACGDGADPRVLLTAFPDLCLSEWPTQNSKAHVWAGAFEDICAIGKGIEHVVMTNLYKNYSPHIKPEHETSALQEQLYQSARQMIQLVLASIYAQNLESNHAIKIAVATALAKLAAEDNQLDRCLSLLQEGFVVSSDLIKWLQDENLVDILARVYDELNMKVELVTLWLKLLDSQTPLAGTRQIAQLLLQIESLDLQQQFAIELLQRDQQTGLHVLWTLANQQTGDQVLQMLESVRAVKPEAVDTYLEGSFFRVKEEHVGLTNVFAQHCISKLSNSETQSLDSHDGEERSHTIPENLMEGMKESGADYRLLQTRLLFILFLVTKSNYDAATFRDQFEKMPKLDFERAIVYARLGLFRQALSTLVVRARDVKSAEVLCLQRNSPVSEALSRKIATQLGLPSFQPSIMPVSQGTPSTSELLQVLIDLLLASEEKRSSPLLARFLTSQAGHLDTSTVLERLPLDITVQDLQSFLERGLQRSLHEKQEMMLIKPLAAFQAIEISARLFEKQKSFGPMVQTDPSATIIEDVVQPSILDKLDAIAAEKVVKIRSS